jgi:hypothetical protein
MTAPTIDWSGLATTAATYIADAVAAGISIYGIFMAVKVGKKLFSSFLGR